MIKQDKALRDKLKNYESPVPQDLWNRIQEAQSSKKRTPVAGFLSGKGLGLALLGIFIFIGAYFGTDTFFSKSAPAENTQTVASKEPALANGHSRILQEEKNLSFTPTHDQNLQSAQPLSTSVNSSTPVTSKLPAPYSGTSNSSKYLQQHQSPLESFEESPSDRGNPSSTKFNNPEGPNNSVVSAFNANESLESLLALSATAATNQNPPWDGNRKARIKTRKSGKTTYTIDLLGGMGGWTSSMKLRSGFNKVNLDRRKETEIPLYATSLTLRTALIQPSGFALYGGVSYSQLIDLFEYNYRTLAPSPTDPNELVPGNRLKKTYNRFHQVDLPIGAGYEFKWKRWSLAMKGGVAINVYAWQKGEILLPGELDPSSITTGASESINIYRTNTGFQGWASIGLQKNVGPGSQIMIEPYLSQHINSLTLSDYALSQRPMRFGIQLGIRKLFFATRQRTCY